MWNLHSLTCRMGSRISFPLNWAPDVYIVIFPLFLSKSFLCRILSTYYPFTFCIICHLLLEDMCVGVGEWFSAQKLQKPRLQAKVLTCLRPEVGGGGVGGMISIFRSWALPAFSLHLSRLQLRMVIFLQTEVSATKQRAAFKHLGCIVSRPFKLGLWRNCGNV